MPSAKLVVDLVPNQVSAVDVKSVVLSFVPIAVVTVVAKLASSFKAAANSFKVFNVPGALSINDVTALEAAVSAYVLVATESFILIAPSVRLMPVPALKCALTCAALGPV